MTSIFVSHSSHDNEAAEELAAWLQEHGYASLFLDFDPGLGIPAGHDWEKDLYQNLRGSQAVVALCSGASAESRWCFAEIALAESLGKRIFPVKVAECTPEPMLSAYQMVDLVSDRDAGFERLLRGLKLSGLDPADKFDWDPNRPPYPALDPFDERDAAVYFGRDQEIGALRELLNRMRLPEGSAAGGRGGGELENN